MRAPRGPAEADRLVNPIPLKKSLRDLDDLMILKVSDATSDRVLVTAKVGHSLQNRWGDLQVVRPTSLRTGVAPRAGGCRSARRGRERSSSGQGRLWSIRVRTSPFHLPWKNAWTARGRFRAGAAIALCGAIYLFSVDTVNGMFLPFWNQYSHRQNSQLTPGQLLALLHRDMAKAILQNANGKPVVLLSSPSSSGMLSTLGGFKTIGTVYWENVDGLKSAAQMLNAQSEEEALAMLKERGVTHISLMTWANFIHPYFQILYPNSVAGKSLENSFGYRALFNKMIPQWARPIPYPPNFLTNALNQDVLMLEIVPDQTREEAEFHLARFLRISEGNPVAAEIMLKGILDRSPSSNVVRIELGELYVDQKRFSDAQNQFILAMEDVVPEVRRQIAQRGAQLLAQRGARTEAEAVFKAGESGN